MEIINEIQINSQRRSFMIMQRYEFMRRFKYKRYNYDIDLLSKHKVTRAKDHNQLKKKTMKYLHKSNRKFLNQIRAI